jgi:hypothetical protein
MAKTNSLDPGTVYLEFYRNLYIDIVNVLNIPYKESRRDLIEIESRYSHEGLSFLTKTLPSLGKAIDKALHSESPVSVPSTFRRQKGQTTPELFRWLFTKVFDPDGNVAVEADVRCIGALRQLVYFLYKLEIPYTKEQERKLLDDFVNVDADLVRDRNEPEDILKTASQIVNDVLWDLDPADIRPQHGPGSVSTGEEPHEKHVFSRLYSALERVYPYSEYMQSGLNQVADSYRHYAKLEPQEAGTAKVVFVPKDSRGPRIISSEPLEYQWIQQGLGRHIVSRLESHWITSGQINFSDQSVNQRLALQGSIDQSLVTLDMKEASDRVSCWLVDALFAHTPQLLAAIMAARSTHTVLPDGRSVCMNKYAPMGSSLCFPVEALCFYVLGVASIMHSSEFRAAFPERGTRGPSYKEALTVARSMIWVYGDDIIVRREFYAVLQQCYPKFKLRLNDDKCCFHGFFRESCGVDAYKGVNVTPLRLKRRWCHRTVDANVLDSYVSLSNNAYSRGYKQVACLAASLVEAKIGPLPTVKKEVDCLALIRPVSVNHLPSFLPKRFSKRLQRTEWYSWAIRPVPIRTDPDSWCMVLRTMSSKRDFTPAEVERKFYSNRSKDLLYNISSAQGHTTPGIYAVTRRSRLVRVWSPFT